MPPGKKAPPQQSSLTELWRKKQNAPAGTSTAQSKTSSERVYSRQISPRAALAHRIFDTYLQPRHQSVNRRLLPALIVRDHVLFSVFP